MSPRPKVPAVWRPSVGFVEVPDFHVEVARRASPEPGGRPLIVGGDPTKRGKVRALSPELRARGLREEMPMREALERAPDARPVRTDMSLARELSGRLRAAVRQEVDAVEIEGLFGFYIEAPQGSEEALELVHRLVEAVEQATGLPLRCGVAPARFAARWAAEDAGRQGARVIDRNDFEAYLLRQPIERLPGVGPKTAARLAELGVVDLPGLRGLGQDRLEILLGNHGRGLWLLACGEDPKPLRARRHPATLSREATFGRARGALHPGLGRLVGRLATALRREGLRASRIALRVTSEKGRTVTRSCVLAHPTDEVRPLEETAGVLLERTGIPESAVRKAGLTLAGLEPVGSEDRQLDLFAPQSGGSASAPAPGETRAQAGGERGRRPS